VGTNTNPLRKREGCDFKNSIGKETSKGGQPLSMGGWQLRGGQPGKQGTEKDKGRAMER